MIEVPAYEGHGRRVLIEFMCWRCKTRVVRPLKDCMPLEAPANHMGDFIPPKEWRNGGFYYPTLCPDCAKKYDEFMKGDESKEEANNE